ncbi:MAG: translocation/assembly module TamB domain-containing protein [Paludibacteraceae bacterium]|nr:translocation/assembly module TamB domain-containing protein [Paludibacteraceae bacterium]
MVIVVSIPLILTLLLSDKQIQNYVVDKAADAASQFLGTKVEIGTIMYEIPASLAIDGVYIEDLDKDTLANIEHLSARIGIKPLFNNHIAIRGINIDGLFFHLKTDSTGVTNLQFIIDALSDTTQTQPTTLTFEAPDINLRNSRFKFDNTSIEARADSLFDAAHIDIRDIEVNTTLHYASADSVNIRLDKLACTEKSGIAISDIDMHYILCKKGMSIEDFKVDMKNSRLNIPVIQFRYDSIQQMGNIKELFDNAKFTLDIKPSYFSGTDFSAFMPQLGKLRYNVNLDTRLDYSNGEFNIYSLNLTYGKYTNIDIRAKLSGIADAFVSLDSIDPGQLYLYAEVYDASTNRADVENTVSDLTGKPFKLPDTIKGLSFIKYKGSILGNIINARYVGRLTTNAGDILTNADFGFIKDSKTVALDGNVKLDDFDFAKIFGDEAGIGKLSFALNTDGIYNTKEKRLALTANGKIASFQYNDYDFNNINIDMIYNPEKAYATVEFIDDKGNGSIDLDAFFDNGAVEKNIDIELSVDSLKPGKMNLLPSLPTFEVSTDIDVDVNINKDNEYLGHVYIDSLKITNEGKTCVIDTLYIDAFKDMLENNHITIESPIINGIINGQYDLPLVVNNVSYIIANELSNIKPLSNIKKMNCNNDFDFELSINPLNKYTDLFGLSFSVYDTTHISGTYNDYFNKLELDVNSNSFKFGTNSIDSINVHIDNISDKLKVQTTGIYQTALDTTHISLSAGLFNNIVDVEYNFWNTIESDFSGTLKASAEFFQPKYPDANIETLITVHNSELTLSDSLWHMREGTVFYDEHNLIVKNIAFEGDNTWLRIDGRAKKDEWQVVGVDMNKVDLSYISKVFYMPDISLLGIATGKVIIGGALDKEPILDADVEVDGFGLNGYKIADAHGTAKFNHKNKRIELFAEVLNEKKDTSYLHGYVAPVEKEMLLDIDINELHLGFIEPYLVSFSHEMDGIASGKLYVGGPLDKIELWGDAYVHDAKLGIDYLGSTFHFADSVHIKKDKFIFKDIQITDDYGHTGMIDGLVTHKYFQNFKYRIGFSIDNVRVLNTTAKDFPDFYGTVYASGNALIEGDESSVDINVTARPEEGSYFAVPLDSYRNATDNQFITFVSKDSIKSPEAMARGRKRFMETAPTTKLNVDIAIEATPNVEARIIMDSHTGDVIRATGNGNIKVNVDQNANVKIYGKFDILEGDYNFSLQGAIRKKFEVGSNSSISFDGDPMAGIMNINAKYQTTASLADLMDAKLTESLVSNVKVNCLAKIQGTFLEPRIKFDLELPDAEDEISRRVHAIVNTEDMMLQQMVFLLLFNKFYNPQVASATTSAATSSYASSFAASTISSQLNYWISQINKNVNFGINYNDSQKDALNNYSVAVNLSTNLFNNRLILYSNVGYQRQYGNENFIGDLDVEYKLTKSGRFRLKAYNKTNDRLYHDNLYTQGLGVMFKENFDTWKNLGATYKELTRKKTPEEKAKIKETKEKQKAEKAKQKAAKKALKEDRKRRHKEYVAQQKALKAAAKAAKNEK